MKTRMLTLMIAMFVASCVFAGNVKYVFLLIGDGYGQQQRYVTEALTGEKLAMSLMGRAILTGHDNVFGATTDSAASGTAIACGIKTYNGAIGLDKDGLPVESLAMKLQKAGFKVAMISSSPLTDATPAAHYAHQRKRTMRKEIGLDLAKSGIAFAGGSGVHDRRTYDDLKKAGWEVLEGSNALLQVRRGVQTFVNFPPYTPWNPDDLPTVPTLADYLKKTIDVFDGPQGFFIMLENGHIDYSGHQNDAGKMWREVLAFDEAVKVALDFQAKRPTETIVVVTADHETGGLTAPGRLDPAKLQVLRCQKAPKDDLFWLQALASETLDMSKSIAFLQESLGIEFTEEERVVLEKNINKAHGQYKKAKTEKSKKSAVTSLLKAAFSMRDERAGIKYTTGSHTSTPILTNVKGPGADTFKEPLENSDIPHLLFAIVLPEEHAREHTEHLLKEQILQPLHAMPEAEASVFDVRLIPLETFVSVVGTTQITVPQPDWAKCAEFTAHADGGVYFAEIKNASARGIPLLAGLSIPTAPSDAKFYVYNPVESIAFLKDDGSAEWTTSEINEKFCAICMPQTKLHLLLCTQEHNSEKPKTRKIGEVVAEYENLAKPFKPFPRVEVSSTTNPPVVDGVLDDQAWSTARKYQFVDVNGEAISNAPSATILIDQKNETLYFGLCALDEELVAEHMKRDVGQYEDDAFELFICDAGSEKYFHIVINAAGAVYDAAGGDAKWDGEFEVKTFHDQAQGMWTAELALPLKQLGIKGAYIGNICHTDRPAATRSNLSPTFGNFHDYDAFLPLIFAE